jgi:hypothetical protein
VNVSRKLERQAQATVVEFQRSAIRSSDFVSTAASPGFSYTYDPEAGVPVRSEFAHGPIYVEPASTVGKGLFDVTVGYLHSDFSELNGESLDSVLDYEEEDRQRGNILKLNIRDLSLTSDTISLSTTYGVLDRLDVNLLVPVQFTQLRLDGRKSYAVAGGEEFRPPVSVEESRLGIGDILLRTKYRFEPRFGLDLASTFTLRVPSGDADDFQGLGQLTLTPLLVLQKAFGPSLVHLNVGVEINADDVSQTRLRYALGSTIKLIGPLSGIVHVIGSSGLEDERFSQNGTNGVVSRTDIVDSVFGFEVALGTRWLAHVAAILPVTDDGLRADVIPACGIGARF